MKTKKVGSAGRYGARYGKRVRALVTEIEKLQRKKQLCPYCKKRRAKRISLGVYLCKKCGSKFTGKAYSLE